MSLRPILAPRAQLFSLLKQHKAARRSYSIPTKKPEPPDAIEPSATQSHPLGRYYEAILNTPSPYPKEKPEEPPTSANQDPEPRPDTEAPPKKPTKTRIRKKPEEAAAASSPSSPSNTAPTLATSTSPFPSIEERARIVFGSSLAGPAKRAQRLSDIQLRSSYIAGVLVPPRPEEPDHCCMSGCVNCVWDQYREEMEAWSLANAEAQKRLRAERRTKGGVPSQSSVDDDGGGSETNWEVGPQKIAKDLWDDSLYRGVPVGIREFMKTEKMLKERHERDGTLGG